jgi:endonuclease/exonuclease/phosphatase (EEP) superfamily protein YafD
MAASWQDRLLGALGIDGDRSARFSAGPARLLRLLQTIAQATVAELCLGGGLLGLLGLAGGWSGWLDVIAAFAPVWLAISVLGAALAWPVLERGSRGPALVAAGAGIVASLVLIAPELSHGAPGPPEAGLGAPLKVLAFNVWDDNRHSEDTAAAIVRSGADVVTIQEFFGLSAWARQQLLAAYPYWNGCPAGCDLVMLSKRPWLVGGPAAAQTDTHDLAIWGETTAPDGGPVWLLTTHYVWPAPPGEQAGQRAKLAEIVGGLDRSDLIVAGDFNLAPWTAALRRQDAVFEPLQRRTHGVFTWPAVIARFERPAPFPILPIDQLYASPVWKTLAVQRLPRAGSDHYGVLVTLARDAPGVAPAQTPAQN